MRKLLALTAGIVLVAAPAAVAHEHGAFTLKHARSVAERYRPMPGVPVRVGACHWIGARHRVADCPATATAALLTGTLPTRITWTDVVSRQGPCLLPTTKRTGPGSGIARGVIRGSGGGCFTGPVVVARRTDLWLAPISVDPIGN